MFCSAAEELIDRKEANVNDTPASRARRTFDKGKRYIMRAHSLFSSVLPYRLAKDASFSPVTLNKNAVILIY